MFVAFYDTKGGTNKNLGVQVPIWKFHTPSCVWKQKWKAAGADEGLDTKFRITGFNQLNSYWRSWASIFWQASLGIGNFDDFCPLLAFES